MKNYFDFSHIKGDLWGGITAGIVALPLALAFGVTSGMGAAFGLYGAIFIGFFAALFGGTNTQISGPTAPMTAVSMVIIAGLIANNDGNLEKAIPTILLVFFLAGLIQIGMGFMGLGKYIKFIPYPVVSGFMTAIGVLILVSQIFPFLGYYPANDTELRDEFKVQAEEVLLEKILKAEADEGILVLEDYQVTVDRAEKEITNQTILEESAALAKNDTAGVIGKFKYLGRAVGNIQWVEVILALITIFIIYGFKRITTAVPSTLVALLIVSIGAYVLRSQGAFTYEKIDEIPFGFPTPRFDIFTSFSLASITPYLGAALTLAFLGAIDSLLTSVVADNLTKTKHQSNKELVGQGIGNSIAAIFQGIPGAGATIRTVVNINAGGKTRISGMIAALLLLVILLALGPLASQIPAAVLAGILITVGIGVMDYKGLKAIPVMPKSEVVILLIVLILSVFWDLIFAVAIGLVVAALVFMKKMGDLTAVDSRVGSLLEEDNEIWEDETEFPAKFKEEVYIKHLNGPLFFGYVSEFQDLASSLPDFTKYVVFRMEKVPYIDQSGLYALEEILLDFKRKGKSVLFTGVREEVVLTLRSLEIIPNLVDEEVLFTDFSEALLWIKNHVKDTN